jgi:hypothetical protein
MRTGNKIVTMLALGAMAVLLAVSGEYFAPLHAEARNVAPRLEGSWEVTVMPDEGDPIVDAATFTSGGGIDCLSANTNARLDTKAVRRWIKETIREVLGEEDEP